MWIALILRLIITVQSYHSTSCFLGCTACQINFITIYCTQCDANRLYNPISGLCDCVRGTYNNGTKCLQCPISCLTCNSSSRCTFCTPDKYLNSLGQCLCQNDWSADENGVCQPPSGLSVFAIVGIVLGGISFIIMIAAVVIYFFYVHKHRIESYGQPEHQSAINGVGLPITGEAEAESGLQLVKAGWVFRQELCSICLDANSFVMTECGHYFHQKCITAWLIKRKSCPNCNRSLNMKQMAKWCDNCRKQLILPHKNIDNMGPHVSLALQKEMIFDSLCADCLMVPQKQNLVSVPSEQPTLQIP